MVTRNLSGIEQEATRVGADVYQMYAVVDVIAHEYEFGEGEHMLLALSGGLVLVPGGDADVSLFRQRKGNLILNYSWDGDKMSIRGKP